MLAPLEQAVRLLTGAAGPPEADASETERDSGRDRVLILVTDGQVGNEDQILERMGTRLARIRVHVVGIDQAVNAGFLSRLAAAGRGRCELVESEDRLDEAAARIHRRIGAPLVTALALAADGVTIVPGTVAPGLLPDLFPGVAVTLAGRWRGQPGGVITVAGTAADGTPFECKVAAVTGGSPASTAAWARAHVRDLEDRYAIGAGHDTAGLARQEQQITEVSLRYGVLCRFTAFVAVDSRVVTDGAGPHRVTQPVELPAGWDGVGFGHPPRAGWVATSAAPAGAVAPSAMSGSVRPRSAMPIMPRSGRASMRARKAVPRSAAGGRAAAPTGVRGTSEVSRLAWARQQAADEADALRAARGAPDAERARLLADLATRIEALLVALGAAPSGVDVAGTAGKAGTAGELAGLARALRACDGPGRPGGARLEALWQEAIRVLTGFAGDAGPRTASRPFWKRS
jgi:Ca-activated chloride channel family protein